MSVVILKAYEPSKLPEVVCRPVQDTTGLTFTGQGQSGYYESLSEEDKRSMGYVITPSTGIRIANGHSFNLENARDKENWKWVKNHPYITLKKLDDSEKPNDAAFYVFDAVTEAKLRVTGEKRRTILKAQVYDLTEEDQRRLAGALGLGDTSGLSIDEVVDWLSQKIDVTPNVVEPLLKDKATVTVQALFVDASNRGIIQKNRGWYKFEEVNLGNGEAQAVEFLRDPANEEIVLAITASLEQTE